METHASLKSSGRLRQFFFYSSILISLSIIAAAAVNLRAQSQIHNHDSAAQVALWVPGVSLGASIIALGTVLVLSAKEYLNPRPRWAFVSLMALAWLCAFAVNTAAMASRSTPESIVQRRAAASVDLLTVRPDVPEPIKPEPAPEPSSPDGSTDLDSGDWTPGTGELMKQAVNLAKSSEDALWALTLLALLFTLSILIWDVYTVRKFGGTKQSEFLPKPENKPTAEGYLGAVNDALGP